MTRPLKHMTGGELREMTEGEFALFRYRLRVRYAADIRNNLTGAIVMGSGTTIGSAVNTERTQNSASTVAPPYPSPSTGTTPRQTYNYGLNLAGAPTLPTDFTNSYVKFVSTDLAMREGNFVQENMAGIMSFIIDPCIEEMKTGDRVGTYRVQIPNPGLGWITDGTFFRDSVYLNGGAVSYPLWLRTSAVAPAAGPIPLKSSSTGLQQHDLVASPNLLEDLVYPMLVSRVVAGALAYTVTTTANPLTDRGVFMDTRFSGTRRDEAQSGLDDYRTTVTPIGPAAEFETYFLGLS